MKMKDELENYVKKHRNQFNNQEVDKDALWSKIEVELTEFNGPIIPLWRRISVSVAASIAIVLGGIFLWNTIKVDTADNSIVHQELLEVDHYYGSLVNNQVELIKNSPDLTQEERDDFLMLIDDLDTEYENLKLELAEGVNDQKIMEAIINNYRKKIQLMESLLEKSFPPKKEQDETEFIL